MVKTLTSFTVGLSRTMCRIIIRGNMRLKWPFVGRRSIGFFLKNAIFSSASLLTLSFHPLWQGFVGERNAGWEGDPVVSADTYARAGCRDVGVSGLGGLVGSM